MTLGMFGWPWLMLHAAILSGSFHYNLLFSVSWVFFFIPRAWLPLFLWPKIVGLISFIVLISPQDYEANGFVGVISNLLYLSGLV